MNIGQYITMVVNVSYVMWLFWWFMAKFQLLMAYFMIIIIHMMLEHYYDAMVLVCVLGIVLAH